MEEREEMTLFTEAERDASVIKILSEDFLNSKKTYEVRVIDFDMSFGNMIMFMIKWAIAAIPALLILFVIGGAVSIFFTALLTGFK